jgi:type III pantothenate kinase
VEKILTIDVGNTFTKLGCFVDGELAASEKIPTDKTDTTIYREELAESLSENGPVQFDAVVVSCVVADLKPLLESVFEAAGLISKTTWLLWDNAKQSDVNFEHYGDTLGTDRMANTIASHYQFPGKNVVVCGFGTAATFDMVDDSGLYLGGAIAPGLSLFEKTLTEGPLTPLHLQVDLNAPPQATPGVCTKTSLHNGIYYGFKGMILEILGNLLQNAGWPLSQTQFVFTGGDAEPVSKMVAFEIPNINIETHASLVGLYQFHLQAANKPTVPSS